MTRAISTRNGEPAYLRAPERKKAPVTMKEWLGRVRDSRGRFSELVCVNAHDRCDGGPCPYCEIKETKK